MAFHVARRVSCSSSSLLGRKRGKKTTTTDFPPVIRALSKSSSSPADEFAALLNESSRSISPDPVPEVASDQVATPSEPEFSSLMLAIGIGLFTGTGVVLLNDVIHLLQDVIWSEASQNRSRPHHHHRPPPHLTTRTTTTTSHTLLV